MLGCGPDADDDGFVLLQTLYSVTDGNFGRFTCKSPVRSLARLQFDTDLSFHLPSVPSVSSATRTPWRVTPVSNPSTSFPLDEVSILMWNNSDS